jgi:hypothetical protein
MLYMINASPNIGSAETTNHSDCRAKLYRLYSNYAYKAVVTALILNDCLGLVARW